MKKILITGGLGYIGYDLVKALVKTGDYQIVIYDNLSRINMGILFNQNLKEKNIKFVEGDILDERKLSSAMESIDIVYHLAAKVSSHTGHNDFHVYDYVNNWGTSNVVKLALSHQVSNVIYLSSLSVFGHSDEEITWKNDTIPVTDYAKSKLNGEKQFKVLDGKIDYTIIRSGNVYGFNPSIRFDTVINNFVYRSIYNQPLLVHGNGREKRGFISVDRLADQLATLVKYKVDSKYLYLCDHNASVIELIEILKEVDTKTEYRHINPDRKMDNQLFQKSTLKGFEILSDSQFENKIRGLYNRFAVKGL